MIKFPIIIKYEKESLSKMNSAFTATSITDDIDRKKNGFQSNAHKY